MAPFYPFNIPQDVQQVLEVIFTSDMPWFMGFNFNGDLQVAIRAPHELIVAALVMPKGAITPPAPTIYCPM